MKNRILVLIILAFFIQKANAQIGINETSTTPNPAAMLDVSSTSKGLLIPRMTTAEKDAIPDKPEGLTVYDTDLKQFSYWTDPGTGFIWKNFGNASSGGGGGEWQLNGDHISNTNIGNIGIGLTNPAFSRLQINGSVGASVAMFGADKTGVSINADNPEVGFNYFYNGTSKTIKAGYGSLIGMYPSTGDMYFGNFNSNQSATDFGDIAGFQTVMTVRQNGNVGIGTASPSNKLEVNGNGSFLGPSVTGGSGGYLTNGGGLTISNNNTNNFIRMDGSGFQAHKFNNGQLGNSASNLLLNPFGGKVGINNNNPVAPLSFANVLGDRISFWANSPTSQFGIGIQGGTLQFYTAGADRMAFGYGSSATMTETMVFYPFSGQLGIGTYNQGTYKLAVAGSIHCTELVVESGWADYVFDEKYKLKSIYEMEAFIKANKHLPNIPKASEIEENGLKVSETNKLMMEKIEEMALYIIQLKKEIDLLKIK